MKRQCICEICTCGCHRCPHKSTALYSKIRTKNAVSEYQKKYPGHRSYQPPTSCKPVHEYKGFEGRMATITTVQADYTSHKVSARPEKKKAQYMPTPGDMDLNSTYKVHYTPHHVEPVASLAPKSSKTITMEKLDAVSVYKENFRKWKPSKREVFKPDMSYHPPTVKFMHTTTSQDDYIPKEIVAQQSFKPPNIASLSSAPFSGQTTNKVSYVPHKLEPRPSKLPVKYKPCSHPFQGSTTYRHCYRGQAGQKSRSYKPKQVKVASDAPLQSNTESRDQYKKWPVSVPSARKGTKYSKPIEKMDLSTTTHTDFVKHKVQPEKPMKPPSTEALSSGPFCGTTTTKKDFRLWESKRCEPVHRTDEIPRAKGKMEDQTTFRAHYVKHPLQPAISYKPIASPLKTDAIMDKNTTYTTEYTLKEIKLCPARFKNPPGFVFETVTEKGHRVFQKLSKENEAEGCHCLAPNNILVKHLEPELLVQ